MTEKKKKRVLFAWENLSLPCEWEDCSEPEEYIGMNTYIDHIQKSHIESLTEEDLKCQWKYCQHTAESLPQLHRHVSFHAFHTKVKCLGRNYQVRENLPNCSLSSHHRNTVVDTCEPLVCYWTDCLVTFDIPEFFYRHVDSHSFHYEIEKDSKVVLKCLWEGCDKTFSSTFKLKEHLRTHTQEKVVACPNCGVMFASRTKLYDHIKRQSLDPENMYICPYCTRQWASQRLLHDHAKVHINHYKCPHCEMTCPTPSNLKAHIEYRHSNVKSYVCHYCEKKFKFRNDLCKHLEIHYPVPIYRCTEDGCTYSSRSRTSFQNHIQRIHKGELPAKYLCHLCAKVCARGNYLTKHLVNKHNFCLPSGHCRFRYSLHKDGYHRLQTDRYESCSDQTEVASVTIEENSSLGSPDSSSEGTMITGIDEATSTMFVYNSDVTSGSPSYEKYSVITYTQDENVDDPAPVLAQAHATKASSDQAVILHIPEHNILSSNGFTKGVSIQNNWWDALMNSGYAVEEMDANAS